MTGKFYTTKSGYILQGLPLFPASTTKIIEPFAGNGDLIDFLKPHLKPGMKVEAYDIEPMKSYIKKRDTLRNPPNYVGAWVFTNPPYLARNKNDEKELYEKYNTNDLYKCAIYSILDAAGGSLIIPSGFFSSPRTLDAECRTAFFSRFRILKANFFEEQVFADTSVAVVSFSFIRSDTPLSSQTFECMFYPEEKKHTFTMDSRFSWVIGGEIYNLPGQVSVYRHTESGKNHGHLTGLTLCALDSGNTRIHLEYKKGYVYPAKESSRTYATLRTDPDISEETQQIIATKFNEFLESKREQYNSMFLPNYREYSRKRIPFDLAYRIVSYLILENQSG